MFFVECDLKVDKLNAEGNNSIFNKTDLTFTPRHRAPNHNQRQLLNRLNPTRSNVTII